MGAARSLGVLAVLGVLVIAAVLLPHHSPSAVLVAHLNASADLTALPTLETTAQHHHAEVTYLIIPAPPAGGQTSQPTESQVMTAIQYLTSPAVPLTVLDEDSWAKLRVPAYTRELDANGNGGQSVALAWVLARVVWVLVVALAAVLLVLGFRPGAAAPSARTSIAPAVPPATRKESLGWWAESASAPQATTAPAWPASPPAGTGLDLSRFGTGEPVDHVALQCPRCGAFTVRQGHADSGGGRAYQCEHCRSAWTLQPSDGWPTVVVRPRFRSSTDRAHPDLET